MMKLLKGGKKARQVRSLFTWWDQMVFGSAWNEAGSTDAIPSSVLDHDNAQALAWDDPDDDDNDNDNDGDDNNNVNEDEDDGNEEHPLVQKGKEVARGLYVDVDDDNDREEPPSSEDDIEECPRPMPPYSRPVSQPTSLAPTSSHRFSTNDDLVPFQATLAEVTASLMARATLATPTNTPASFSPVPNNRALSVPGPLNDSPAHPPFAQYWTSAPPSRAGDFAAAQPTAPLIGPAPTVTSSASSRAVPAVAGTGSSIPPSLLRNTEPSGSSAGSSTDRGPTQDKGKSKAKPKPRPRAPARAPAAAPTDPADGLTPAVRCTTRTRRAVNAQG